MVTEKITNKSIYEIKRTIYYFYYYYLFFKLIIQLNLNLDSFYRQYQASFNFKKNHQGCRIVW